MGSVKKAFDLTGKVALVTGGSRGLGLQIAEALGEQGARVILSSRKAADLEQACSHLSKLGYQADAIAADNSSDADIARLVDDALAKFGKIDILFNNAGANWGAATEDHLIEAWDKVMNLNIRSLFVLSQQVAKRSMIPNKYGRIVNMASIAGLVRMVSSRLQWRSDLIRRRLRFRTDAGPSSKLFQRRIRHEPRRWRPRRSLRKAHGRGERTPCASDGCDRPIGHTSWLPCARRLRLGQGDVARHHLQPRIQREIMFTICSHELTSARP